MKRELKLYQRVTPCCPGHDDWPHQTYSNRRSKKARAKWKKKEHKYARTLRKRILRQEVEK